MTAKVTVAIPTFNRAGYLRQCLSAILNQTFRDLEIIVSDNCSMDSTMDMVRAFSDPRIRYLRNESNVGVFPNMNRCLDLAQGEYVSIVHDDDLFAPQFIQQECDLLDQHENVGMVHCAAYEIDSNRIPQGAFKAYPQTRIMEGKQVFVRFLQGHNVYCPTVMARKKLYQKVGPFDPRYRCADYLMWMRMALQADVAYIAQPLAAVRIHPERLSSDIQPIDWFDEFVEIFELGLKWGEAECRELLGTRDDLLRKVAGTQGRRFFITALAAAAAGETRTAQGCVEVLRRLQAWGLPRRYALSANMGCNPAGQIVLSSVKRLRRFWATRDLPGQVKW